MKQGLFIILLLFAAVLPKTQAQDSAPRFPGCEEAGKTDIELEDCAERKMLQFIHSNFKFPEEARKAGAAGEVVVAVEVGADGSIKNPKVSKGLGHGCDEEILRVIGLMPKWTPGKIGGAAADSNFEIRVTLK